MRTVLVVVSLVSIVSLACGSSSPPPSPPPTVAMAPEHIDGTRAHELVKNGAVLVDARSAEEYAGKHIEGAINVPADAVTSHDFGGKDKPIVLYCTAGHRSERAAETLRGSGYTHVYVLGPMSAWGE